MHREFAEQPVDEVLESIWRLQEGGTATLSALLAQPEHSDDRELVQSLVAAGLVHLDGDHVALTPSGEARARSLVRCHRLAERLLADVLSLPADESEQTACLMEHVLSPVVADAVCAFLGHPPTSPGGLAIPPGACCSARARGVRPVVVPLAELEPGRDARIVFMAQRADRRVDRLANYGVVPGSVVHLRQKHPSFVIEMEGTRLALDADVARDIFVRREG